MNVVESRGNRHLPVLVLHLLCLCLCLCAVTVSAGQMYRWTDADGKVHFSDQPPPEGADPVAFDNKRMSIVDTVVVKENAMRSVIEKEARRQADQREAQVNAANRANAKAERDKEKRCAALRRQIERQERSGTLIGGRMKALDEQYSENCR